jgi:hypothetical protein
MAMERLRLSRILLEEFGCNLVAGARCHRDLKLPSLMCPSREMCKLVNQLSVWARNPFLHVCFAATCGQQSIACYGPVYSDGALHI